MDGTVTGTLGETFGRLGQALNRWQTWGVLILLVLGYGAFNLLRMFVAAKITKTDDRDPKATLLAGLIGFLIMAGVAGLWSLFDRPR